MFKLNRVQGESILGMANSMCKGTEAGENTEQFAMSWIALIPLSLSSPEKVVITIYCLGLVVSFYVFLSHFTEV